MFEKLDIDTPLTSDAAAADLSRKAVEVLEQARNGEITPAELIEKLNELSPERFDVEGFNKHMKALREKVCELAEDQDMEFIGYVLTLGEGEDLQMASIIEDDGSMRRPREGFLLTHDVGKAAVFESLMKSHMAVLMSGDERDFELGVMFIGEECVAICGKSSINIFGRRK